MPGPSPLSPTEADFLRTHGGAAAIEALDQWSAEVERQDRTHAAVRQLADTAADTVSIAEAAALLGLDPARISRRIRAKTLWAYRLRKRWRVPRWQFGDDGLLPGLEVIVPAIADDASPSVLEAFMGTPQPDFGGSHRSSTSPAAATRPRSPASSQPWAAGERGAALPSLTRTI